MYNNIVLAYDGSQSGQQALLESREIAQWGHARLNLVAVMPSASNFVAMEGSLYDPDLTAQETKRFEGILADGERKLADGGYSAKSHLLVGESVYEITHFAQNIGADLIVVGHKHLDSWAARWWRGSVSGNLIEHAPCSVLCVITH